MAGDDSPVDTQGIQYSHHVAHQVQKGVLIDGLWAFRLAITTHIGGHRAETGIRKRGHDITLLLLLNAYHEPVEFTLPAAPGGSAWDCLVDTNEPEAEEVRFAFKKKYLVTGRSLVLFRLRPERQKRL